MGFRRCARRRRSGGRGLAVLVVDLSRGFTDPECALGSDLTAVVEATNRVLAAARDKGLPVSFTTIGYESNLKDGGLWMQKVPSLADLQMGGKWVEIDPRLEPQFFAKQRKATWLQSELKRRRRP